MNASDLPPTPKNCLLVAGLVIAFFLMIFLCIFILGAFLLGGISIPIGQLYTNL